LLIAAAPAGEAAAVRATGVASIMADSNASEGRNNFIHSSPKVAGHRPAARFIKPLPMNRI
jgi:hypothetical protein